TPHLSRGYPHTRTILKRQYLKRIPGLKTASFSSGLFALLMMYLESCISITGYVFADYHKAEYDGFPEPIKRS
ncbi:MAG: hypothetical protein Q4D24_12485, partial [Erysipelotrichaceae bacterium]|nr:hypothetical protein [Erysipelotrichaceae bacterium]